MRTSNVYLALLLSIVFVVTGIGQEQSPSEQTDPVSTVETAEKPEGAVRIGVVTPNLKLGQEAAGAEAAAAVRELFVSYIKGPTIDVVEIESRTPTNAAIEAGQKGCDMLLFVGISKKAKSSLFSSLVRAAVPVVAGKIPGAAVATEAAGSVGNVKQAAVQGGRDFVDSAIASKFGAKDEVVVDFTLANADARSVVAKGANSAKVKSDGEDVLTNLIEEIAEKVVQVATKRQ